MDNSGNRRKTMVVSTLLFLFAGGGIFLFFIIQGSNDLTKGGKQANFSYGEAAREGVSSFFKSVGVIPEEEPRLSESAIDRNESRGLPLEDLGVASASPDMSDWMAKADHSGSHSSPGRSASPSVVPKMSGGASSLGGGGGGGGSKSAGGVSRFGAGSGEGTTSVSNKSQGAAGGTGDKGTLATLKNTRALLGEGLRSGSAMTANAKWNQSFGVGSGSNKGGDLAYNKGGLVGLDKIKSGEISDLKMDKKGGLKAAPVSDPTKDEEGTKKALQGDAAVQAAAAEKKKENEKKEIAKAAIDAAGQGLEKGMNSKDDTAGSGGESGGASANGVEQPPEDVMNSINEGTCGQGCTTEDGAKYDDDQRNITKNDDGTWTCEFKGTQTNADGTVITYSDKVTYSPKGEVLDLVVEEKPK